MNRELPPNVLSMNGAPEAAPPRATTRTFDDPAMRDAQMILGNRLLTEIRRLGYPGVTANEMHELAGHAIRKGPATNAGATGLHAASSDTRLAVMVASALAEFLGSKTERELKAMRQPPASAATAGADKDKPNKDGIDPLTGLVGVERPLGGMRTATTAGTNVDSGNSGGNARGTSGSSAAYGAMDGEVYNPSKGIGTLTERNFHTSEFARAGLGVSDISTIKTLSSQGFDASAIKQAGRDRDMLGLGKGSPLSQEEKQQSLKDTAVIRRAGARYINSLHEYDVGEAAKGERAFIAAQTKAEKAERKGDHEAARRAREEMDRIHAQQDAEIARRAAQAPDADTQAAMNRQGQSIFKSRVMRQQIKRGLKVGLDSSTERAAHDGDQEALKRVQQAQWEAAKSGTPQQRQQAAQLASAEKEERRLQQQQTAQNRGAEATKAAKAITKAERTAVKAERTEAKEDMFADLVSDGPKKAAATQKPAAAPAKPDSTKTATHAPANAKNGAVQAPPRIKVAGGANPAA